MSTIEIINKLEELKAYEAIATEAAAVCDGIKDEIKRHMDALGISELTAGTSIVRYTEVQSSRFDTKRFKQELGEQLYKSYCRETLSRRFTISE